MDLVDSSVWVEHLRRTGSSADMFLTDRLRRGEVPAITEPIAMKLLAGAGPFAELAAIEGLTAGLETLRIEPALDFVDAAAVYRAARAGGQTIRRMNDCLIAVIAHRQGARVVHRDADFEAIATVLPVQTLDLRDLP